MSESATPTPFERFLSRLKASLADGSFVRLRLTSPTPGAETPERQEARLITIRGEIHLSVISQKGVTNSTRNLQLREVSPWLNAQLKAGYHSTFLNTTQGDLQWTKTEAGKQRLVVHAAAKKEAPALSHDRESKGLLDQQASDWLESLGLTDASGKPKPSMAAKLGQVNRYLELMQHLIADCGWTDKASAPSGPIQVLDVGCGKGYLTFGLWHLLTKNLGLAAEVTGIELRPELVNEANLSATAIGATALQFESGDLGQVGSRPVDILVALHACDTTTDEALRIGVKSNARLIVVAPCCQKELRKKMDQPAPLAGIMKHGLMEGRIADWLTDGLRALALEAAGYETKVIEFVSPDHTPKNLMLTAVRRSDPRNAARARDEFEQTKIFFGVKRIAVDQLLETKSAS